MTKLVINTCFGGFGLSQKVYEKFIEWGVPVRVYTPQERDPETGRYKDQPLNDGEVLFDRTLKGDDSIASSESEFTDADIPPEFR